jgi:hypothetical protein
MISLCKLCAPLCLCGETAGGRVHHGDTELAQSFTEKALTRTLIAALLIFGSANFSLAQNQTKRNDRPQPANSASTQREENKKPAD